jgi:hypothetical protein
LLHIVASIKDIFMPLEKEIEPKPEKSSKGNGIVLTF